MEERKQLHPAWFVMVGGILYFGALVGLLVNTCSVFYPSLRETLGCTTGQFSLYTTLRTLTSALVLPFSTKLMFKVGVKRFLPVQGVLLVACFACLSLVKTLPMLYAVAVCSGVFLGVSYVPIPIIINNWFHKKAGTALGVSLAASGALAAVMNPVCGLLVQAIGWQSTLLLLCGFALLLVLPATLFLLPPDPQSVGKTPYGYEEKPADAATVNAAPLPERKNDVFGFLMVAIATSCIYSAVGISGYFTMFAQSAGYGLTFGASMMSISMITNVLSKVVLGVLADKLGPWKAVFFGYICSLTALTLFVVLFRLQPALLVASLLFGFTYGMAMMAPTILCRAAFGNALYKDQLATITAIYNFASAAYVWLIGLVSDATGSYHAVFIMCLCVIALSLCCTLLLRRHLGKNAAA